MEAQLLLLLLLLLSASRVPRRSAPTPALGPPALGALSCLATRPTPTPAAPAAPPPHLKISMEGSV